MHSTLLPLMLVLCGPLHAETRSCHGESETAGVRTEVDIRVRFDQQAPTAFAIETVESWDLGGDSGYQVFSASIDTDAAAGDSVTVTGSPDLRRFRIHPDGNDEDDDTVVRIRKVGRTYEVDVDRVARYHRGMAPFPRHAVLAVDGADCHATLFEP